MHSRLQVLHLRVRAVAPPLGVLSLDQGPASPALLSAQQPQSELEGFALVSLLLLQSDCPGTPPSKSFTFFPSLGGEGFGQLELAGLQRRFLKHCSKVCFPVWTVQRWGGGREFCIEGPFFLPIAAAATELLPSSLIVCRYVGLCVMSHCLPVLCERLACRLACAKASAPSSLPKPPPLTFAAPVGLPHLCLRTARDSTPAPVKALQVPIPPFLSPPKCLPTFQSCFGGLVVQPVLEGCLAAG